MTRLLIATADEAADRQLAEWLCREGRELISVPSASEALMTVMTREVDLAFVDLDLEELSGPRAVQLIRQCRPRLPVVILAGELTPGSLARIRGAGIFFTLLKPLDRAEVEAVAASALGRWDSASGTAPRRV
jgi:CheY-like chemotaxis protein